MSDPREIELEQQSPEDPSDADSCPPAGSTAGSVESEAAERAGPAADLETQLRAAEESAQQHLNDLLRARAELENVRRRGHREVERARKYALERFMLDLLEVRDSLERAEHVGQDEAVTVEHLIEGTDLTFKLLKKVLDKYGLEEVDPLGERFDPERHEAISVAPPGEHAPDTVVQVVQKGYLLNDRLIRAARVIVAAPG